MKNLIILLIPLILNQFVLAQQSQQTNPYTKQSNKIYDKIQIDLPLVDHNQLLKQDLSRNPGEPFKYGHKHLVNYSPHNSGKWEETTTGGRLWHITFKSKNAFALSIDFDQFYIPKGGELYIYINQTMIQF